MWRVTVCTCYTGSQHSRLSSRKFSTLTAAASKEKNDHCPVYRFCLVTVPGYATMCMYPQSRVVGNWIRHVNNQAHLLQLKIICVLGQLGVLPKTKNVIWKKCIWRRLRVSHSSSRKAKQKRWLLGFSAPIRIIKNLWLVSLDDGGFCKQLII